MMLYSRRCAVLQCAAIFMRFLFKSGMSQNADDPHTFRKQYLASTSEDLQGNEQTCEPRLTICCMILEKALTSYFHLFIVELLLAIAHLQEHDMELY